MHSVCTFVLRLFIDPDIPGEINGSIQGILDTTPIPFNNLDGLMTLMENLAQAPQKSQTQPYSNFDGGQL